MSWLQFALLRVDLPGIVKGLLVIAGATIASCAVNAAFGTLSPFAPAQGGADVSFARVTRQRGWRRS